MERPVPEDPRRRETWRLAAQLRRIIDRLAVVDAPAAELARAADAAQTFADRLDEMLPKERHSYEGHAEATLAGDPNAIFDRSPIMGLANPIAAPVHLRVTGEGDDRRVEGHATFGAAYEGPPGCLHGGHVAAAFDDVLGLAQTFSGQIGMTGTLTVRYRSPTPLGEELSFRAWIDRVEGRKTFTKGTCHAGDRLTAEAEAVFITIDPERFGDVVERAR